jgi:hypothetical protein
MKTLDKLDNTYISPEKFFTISSETEKVIITHAK